MVLLLLMLLVLGGGGLALLLLIAWAVVSKRPGVAALLGGLLIVGLFGAVTLLSYLAMPALHFANQPQLWEVRGFDRPIVFRSFSDGPAQVRWRVSLFGLLLVAGVVIAVMVALIRRGTPAPAAGHRRGWWPALLVLPLLMLFWGSVRVQKSTEFPLRHEVARREAAIRESIARQKAEVARQQAELERRAAQLEGDLHRRIATMDIHELMDMFDAPRIMLPIPTPANIALLANSQLQKAALDAASSSDHESQAEAAGEGAATAEKTGTNESTTPDGGADAQLHAEADAAVKLIAAEQQAPGARVIAEQGDPPAQQPDNEVAHRENATAVPALESDPRVEAEAPELSTPIAAVVPARKSNQPRPEWIDNPPKRIGEVRREVVATDEWSAEDIERARDIGLMLKVYEHIQRLNGEPYHEYLLDQRMVTDAAWSDHRLDALRRAGITLDFVETEIAKDEYVETVERSVGPMTKSYTLLEFNLAVDRRLRQRWDAYQRQERFAVVGVGGGAVLSLLGLCYALLKVDTWTKGYYTKRLFLGVPAAIIGIVTLLAFLMRDSF